jgi:phosphoribosylglycinamide formyltransferase-1
VISNNKNAYALERAKQNGIEALAISPKDFASRDEFNQALLEKIQSYGVDLVVLAGCLVVIPKIMVDAYPNKIINIHPALLPKFGGKDFYGIHVHEAVLAAGETESGATVHYVDEGVDTGKIILQEKVPVLPGDEPQTLRERVLEVEHKILPEAIAMIEKARH